MKKKYPFFALAFLVIVFGFFKFHQSTQGSDTSGLQVASPLPQGLSTDFKDYPTKDTFWKPNMENLAIKKDITPPVLSAKAGISYDLTTNTLLYKNNVNTRLPIASLTKIMTAIVALENENLNDQITVSKSAATLGEDSMGLSEGESLSLKDMLYGVFLHSGNDAAQAIAEASPYGEENFVYIMNKEAEQLGLSDTHFTNSTGLQGDGNQYSTAYDLLVITKYGLDMPAFRKVAGTVEYTVYSTEHNKAYYLSNETNLLTSYPGVKGIKTGYTPESGMCLVTYLEHDGHKIVAVLLNSQDRRQEMKDLLDYSLRVLGDTPPAHS